MKKTGSVLTVTVALPPVSGMLVSLVRVKVASMHLSARLRSSSLLK